MKKHVVFIFLLLALFVQNTFAGEKNNGNQDTLISKLFIIHPFGIDTVLKSVKYGDRIKYKICNVNTLKVNAGIRSIAVDYDFKDSIGITLKILKSVKDTNNTSPDDKSTSGNGSDITGQLNEDYLNLVNALQKIMSRYILKDNLTDLIPDSVFIKDIDALKNKSTSEYLACYDSVSNAIIAKRSVQSEFEKLDKVYLSFITKYKAKLDEFNMKISKVKKGSNEAKDITLSIGNFIKTYAYADSLYNKLKDINARNAIIKKSFAGIDLYHIIQKDEFAVYTESEPAVSDEVILYPMLKNYKGEILKEFAPYYIKTTGRLKVDFSTGYLLSFVGDDNFSKYTILKDSIIGIRRGNSSNLTHALGALAHVYCTNTGYCNIALSTGVSLTGDKIFGFYFGTTGLFQGKNRLALTAGLSLTPVKRLNTSNLVYDRHYRSIVFSSISDNEIKYDLVSRPAFFIGVTYNLSGK